LVPRQNNSRREAENPVEGYACVLPRRISNPLKDVNIEIGVSKRLAPGKSMVKSASWSDFAGAAAAASKVAASEAGASATSKKVTAEVVVAEAGAARARNMSAAEAPANTKAVATEARAKKKSAAAVARAAKKATKKANKAAAAAAAAAEAAAEKPCLFTIPSEEYFNLWEDPKDREEIRASFTRIAELLAQ